MLLAVHISDGYLSPYWILGGFAALALLAWYGSLGIRDEEIPRIGLMTAVFFIASSIHIKLPPTSVHLLFNGLVGILLGWRAALAIPVGLFLQAALLGHGGFLSLGVNACVMTLPAIAVWGMFRLLQRIGWRWHPWLRLAFVAGSGALWAFSLVFTIGWLAHTGFSFEGRSLDAATAWDIVQSPWMWGACLLAAIGLATADRYLETSPEFPLGLFLGLLAVLLTLALNFAVLVLGVSGEPYFPFGPELYLLGHLPIALVEGLILGFTVGFLASVKPDMLHT